MPAPIAPQRQPTPESTVGEIVAADYRTAAVFEAYGIDFCCGGQVSLAAACREAGIDPENLLQALAAVGTEPVEHGRNYAAWDLAFLADYIVNTHHAYLKESDGQLLAYTRKIAEVHGGRHPELAEIADLFARIAGDLTPHLRDEEEQVFPALKRAEAAVKAGVAPAAPDRTLLATALPRLSREHEEVGAAIHAIRKLSQDYLLPADACTTFTLTYRMLEEFEDDLHQHVHLENNILFPKAAQL